MHQEKEIFDLIKQLLNNIRSLEYRLTTLENNIKHAPRNNYEPRNSTEPRRTKGKFLGGMPEKMRARAENYIPSNVTHESKPKYYK